MEARKYAPSFQSCLTVDSEGRSGGLALLWNTEVRVSILSFSINHIHVLIHLQDNDSEPWLFTSIYGFSKVKNIYWRLIYGSEPWLFTGKM